MGKLHEPNKILLRTLESQNIQKLAPNTNNKTKAILNPNEHKNELKKLNHSILVSYLELLDVLIKAPSYETSSSSGRTIRDQKLDDLEVLFKNMHHRINELRPHQARDSLICLMEVQKQERVELARKFRCHLERCVQVLTTCIKSIDERSSTTAQKSSLLDEINQMMSKLNRLEKSLEPRKDLTLIKSTETPYLKLNGFHHEKTPNHNHIDEPKKTPLIDSTVSKQSESCDFRDEVLCELIDDYLINDF